MFRSTIHPPEGNKEGLIMSLDTLSMHRRGIKQDHPGGAILEPPSTQPPTQAPHEPPFGTNQMA